VTSTLDTPPATTTPQVAVNDIGDEQAFIDAIDETIKYFNDGDIVEGVIVKVDRDEVLLDIGYKTEGVIPSRELSIKHDVDPNDVVKVGDEIEALVLQKEDKEGRLILSKKRAQYERAWGTIEKIKDEDGIVTGTVIEVVKGGLILDIGLRGFLPASLVEMRRVRDLQPYVGKELEAKIIELDKNRNNVVLSRRSWLEQTQSEVRQGFLTTLQKGQVRSGVVSSIVNFGAFVDLGGVDGLVHVSELSWKHIDHPSEVVEVGQEVTVEVLDVDLDRERVSLSLKATQEDPWRQFARTHAIGQVVPGRVTKLVPFGAFVRVDEGIEGLVHISELAERHVEIPEQVVNVGDEISVKVIDIDLERRRISLSLKQATEGTIGEAVGFDPAQYGMDMQYDEAGNYIYPEGFDQETGEWKEGFEEQREAWERQYAEAHARWEAQQAQLAAQAAAAAEAAASAPAAASYSSETPEEAAGTLAGHDDLAALREQLAASTGEATPAKAAEAAPAEATPAEATPATDAAPAEAEATEATPAEAEATEATPAEAEATDAASEVESAPEAAAEGETPAE
jgi:small subunit ribosomal protein S1